MKRVLSFILVVVMICSMFSGLQLTASAANGEDELTSGSCGENVTYSFNSSTGTLTVSGTGEMTDFNADNRSPFQNNIQITTLIVQNGVTSIGDMAFWSCRNLSSITMAASVKTIGDGAFYGCNALVSYTPGSGVTTLRNRAFCNCTGLSEVTIKTAFSGCPLTSITVTADNTVYDSRENCNAIIRTATNELIKGCGNTIIPDTVTGISDSAFHGCTDLTNITIPASVTTIGETAFGTCISLTSIHIPGGVNSIGERAFDSCRDP